MIEEKRRSLENFIREQTIGPGASGKRFVDLLDLRPTVPGTNQSFSSEVLNTVPGAIYSTGILFPVDDTRGNTHNNRTTEKITSDSGEISNPIAETEEEVVEEVEEEDEPVEQQSLNQMYPNSMGFTVCLGTEVLNTNEIELVVSGRYYTKINLGNDHARIAVQLEQELITFDSFLQFLPDDDIIRQAIRIEQGADGDSYLLFNGDATTVSQVKSRIYELKRKYLEQFKGAEKVSAKSLDILKERLFDDLRRKVLSNSEEGKKITEKLRQIEAVESSMAHVLDLIGIYDANGYGVWKCQTFEKPVNCLISQIKKRKEIFTFHKVKELEHIFRVDYLPNKWASLSVNLQYSDHRDKGKVFLKVQLVNTSKHFDDSDTRGGRNFFSLASEEINRRCFFGVTIRASSKYLKPYRDLTIAPTGLFGEDDINKYIYREYEDYGVGHGCSVKWTKQNDQWAVATEYIPACETPDIDPTPRFRQQYVERGDNMFSPQAIFQNARFFEFKWLSTLSKAADEDVLDGLGQFVNAYENWIESQNDSKNQEIVLQLKANCRKDAIRLRKNIKHLSANSHHLKCFRLMNTAMFMQLWHSVKKDKVKSFMIEKEFHGFFEHFYSVQADDHLFPGSGSAAWRPFQLAFILLNIDGVFQCEDDLKWSSRNEWVDLVWFPTGGGKTEAYLGLIALTILNRRQAYGARGGGTAVIMRYTLRLLTAQQFQRATFLIMALEIIRRWGIYELGEEPIYIGLFVGKSSLPNKLRGDDSLLEEYKQLREAQKSKRSANTKIQLKNCPCCGQPLDPITFWDITDKNSNCYQFDRILLTCSDETKKCAFSYTYPIPSRRKDQGPIPVSMCDEEIYQHPPALLFGTVDKFAQIAHKVSNMKEHRNADSRRLFGKGNWEAGKPTDGYITPDLIIQDELHLMMGPLGSAVALFESAIDQLCARNENGRKIRPKVISSTATTRNTDLQIMALFNRKVNLFPKPGIHCDDSFFAFYKRKSTTASGVDSQYESKRRYIGILPTGRTQMWMQLRLAAIMFTHRAIFESQKLNKGASFDPSAYSEALIEAIDYYHTVLTYFNSLREVGKTESQIFTYLIKETRRVFNRVLRPEKLMHCFYTYTSCFKTGELTGRLTGEEVIEQMSEINEAWSPVKRLVHGDERDPQKGFQPPDLVIATNMISVGIDISRFNTMIINCMPRNIAEYIQASSRVARNKEGLVATVHHPFRSRDISHYEKFIEFHEKMYSYVEPISITPFTRKALERYLPLYIATMLRHTSVRHADREGANILLSEMEKEAIAKGLLQYFNERQVLMHQDIDISSLIKDLLTIGNLDDIKELIARSLSEWQSKLQDVIDQKEKLVFNNKAPEKRGTIPQRQLYIDIDEYQDNVGLSLWRIPQSLRVVDPEAVIHIEPK